MTATIKVIIRVVLAILCVSFLFWGRNIQGYFKLHPQVAMISLVVFVGIAFWIIAKNETKKP